MLLLWSNYARAVHEAILNGLTTGVKGVCGCLLLKVNCYCVKAKHAFNNLRHLNGPVVNIALLEHHLRAFASKVSSKPGPDLASINQFLKVFMISFCTYLLCMWSGVRSELIWQNTERTSMYVGRCGRLRQSLFTWCFWCAHVRYQHGTTMLRCQARCVWDILGIGTSNA